MRFRSTGKSVRSVSVLPFITAVCILLFCASCIFPGSCDHESGTIPETDGNPLVQASFEITVGEDKALNATVDLTVTEYRYTAVPLFTLAEGHQIYGVCPSECSIGADGTVSLGYFTQGKWRFHLYAYNRDGYLIREGETEVYLFRGINGTANSIPVTLLTSQSRKGKCHFLIETNRMQAVSAYHEIGVRWHNVLTGADTGETFYRGTGSAEDPEKLTFDFTVLNLKAGIYEFTVSLYETDHDIRLRNAGQTVSTVIIGEGGTTEIRGTLYPNEWVNGGFVLDIPSSVNGKVCLILPGGGHGTGDEFEGKLGSSYEFFWKVDENSVVPTGYQWYVNGIKQEGKTSSNLVFTPSDFGNWTISCTTVDKTGFEMGYDSANLMVADGRSSDFSCLLTPSSSTYDYSSAGTMKNDSLVSVTWENGGTVLFSGYPEFTLSAGAYQATVTAVNGRTVTVKLKGGTLSVTGMSDSGDRVSVRGRL